MKTSYSEIMGDPAIYNIIDCDFKQAVFECAFKKIFGDMGILKSPNYINYNGMKLYCINNSDPGADLSISVGPDAVFCVDYKSAQTFEQYFSVADESILKLLRYVKQIGV